MKRILFSLLMLFPLTAHAAPELAAPKLMAVYFYADWCGSCKILTPKYGEARAKGDLDKKEVLFVTMDLTDKTSIHQSILLAQALGIGEYLKAQGSATGYIALLEAGTKKELARFDSASPVNDIQKVIGERLK
jgi:thiol-disulfide isomerase/thioredoxin